jgi:hypothetical protein
MRRTHGLSHTPEYHTRRNIIERCTNTNSRNYSNYGGRGIAVCQRWMESVENFIEDMGKRPSAAHVLGRVDINGNYSPENCVWTTMDVQVDKKRCIINSKEVRTSSVVIAKELGMTVMGIRRRSAHGQDLHVPSLVTKYYLRGKQVTLNELSSMTGIPPSTCWYMMRYKSLSPLEILTHHSRPCNLE